MRLPNAILLLSAFASLTVSWTAVAEPAKKLASPPSTSHGTTGPEGTPAVIVDDDKVQSLLGKVVTSQVGDKLGQITDVLVGHGGDIRAAVVDFGGFLGVGTRKVAVAWTSLKFSPDTITLNMTRDGLRVTPEYREHEPIVIVGPTTSSQSLAAPTKQKTAK